MKEVTCERGELRAKTGDRETLVYRSGLNVPVVWTRSENTRIRGFNGAGYDYTCRPAGLEEAMTLLEGVPPALRRNGGIAETPTEYLKSAKGLIRVCKIGAGLQDDQDRLRRITEIEKTLREENLLPQK